MVTKTRRAVMFLAVLPLFACAGMTPQDRALLAADVQDTVEAVKPFIENEDVRVYLAALEPMLDAVVNSEQMDFATAIAAVRAAEPAFRAAMVSEGYEPREVDLLLVPIRSLLRRVEAGLAASRPPGE